MREVSLWLAERHMPLAFSMFSGLEVILVAAVSVWCILGLIMLLEDENRGKVAHSNYDWIVRFAPRWYIVFTAFVALLSAVVFVLSRYIRL